MNTTAHVTAATDAETTAAAWDSAAQGWDRHSGLIRAWLEPATAAMLDAVRLAPGQSVLDLAAGAGDQTLDIARRVGPTGQVLAVDISEAILRLAAEKVRAAGLTQVRFAHADAQALGPEVNSFDAVVCRLGLMFCQQPVLALRQAHAALVAGGRFSALVFAGPKQNPCIAATMAIALRHAGVTARDPATPGGLLSLGNPHLLGTLMTQAGFDEIEVRALSAPFRTPRCEDYVEFVRGAGSPVIELLKPLPAAARESAWQDITEQLRSFATPHGWVGPNELLLCAGRRAGHSSSFDGKRQGSIGAGSS